MKKLMIIVGVDLPQGVSADEMASHIADAHRAAVRRYSPDDPIAAAGELQVFIAMESQSEAPDATSSAEVFRLFA